MHKPTETEQRILLQIIEICVCKVWQAKRKDELLITYDEYGNKLGTDGDMMLKGLAFLMSASQARSTGKGERGVLNCIAGMRHFLWGIIASAEGTWNDIMQLDASSMTKQTIALASHWKTVACASRLVLSELDSFFTEQIDNGEKEVPLDLRCGSAGPTGQCSYGAANQCTQRCCRSVNGTAATCDNDCTKKDC